MTGTQRLGVQWLYGTGSDVLRHSIGNDLVIPGARFFGSKECPRRPCRRRGDRNVGLPHSPTNYL